MNAPAKVVKFKKPLAPQLPALPEPVYANASEWQRERARLTRCPSCGGLRLLASPHPHAPRFTKIKGAITRVDCVGKEIAQ